MTLTTAIRAQVRQQANERYEYCHKPEAYSGQKYHVDHIISRKHKGSDQLTNLAWACFQCNICKGTDIAAIDTETDSLVPLFNPRNQIWSDHFELHRALIVGKTASARVTIELLQMNHADQVETRRLLIEHGLW